MIQNHRFGVGLNKYLPYIAFKDNSITSDKYFRVLDSPDRLYVGKTSFRLRANFDTLVVGSTIYIDIIDSAGNTIYHEVIDAIGKDKSRIIVAHIYENTAPGEATLYIAGRMKYNVMTNQEVPYNTDTDSWDYIHYPNIIWSKKIVVIPTNQNDDEVLFISSPIVSCHERSEYFSSAPVSSRKKVIRASGSEAISLASTIQPFQYSNTSKYSKTFNETGKYLDLDPSGSQDFIQSKQIQVPEYFGFNTIKSSELNFNKDMVGGKITVKSPNGLNTEYSASILKVIDRNTIQVDSPFEFNNDGQNVGTFISATDFTASYISRDVPITTFETESFVQIDFKNLEPVAGTVHKIRISYKPFGTFGEFIGIGEFPVKEQNFLVDSSSLLPDKISIIEQPIGDLSGSYGYEQYWQLVPNPNLNLYTSIEDSFTFDRGASIYYTASSAVTASNVDYLAYLKLKQDYGITACVDTEFKLGISTRLTEQSNYNNILSDYKYDQIDVYISGSSVISDDVHNTKLQPLVTTREFGTYIGSISTLKSSTQLDSKLYFKTIDSGIIYPIFIFRSGNGWEFKEITLSPRNELGYSPNQCKLMVPINTLKTDVELVMKMEYLSSTGKKSDLDTVVYGLSFKGSGLPIDRLFKGSGMVTSSQQVATGSYTGSFYGDFFGIPTGSSTIQYYQTHTQLTASTTWSFDHGLSWRYPIITVWDSSNEVVIPQKISADSVYRTSIYFPIPVAGFAVGTVGSIMPTGALSFNNLNDKPTLFSSSQQVNLFQAPTGSYLNVNEVYFSNTGSNQEASGSVKLVKWNTTTPVIIKNGDGDTMVHLTSGSGYYILSSPGAYEINSAICLSGSLTEPVIFYSTIQQSGSSAQLSVILSSSLNTDRIARLHYVYTTTGSADKVGLSWYAPARQIILAETSSAHSYFKIQRLQTL